MLCSLRQWYGGISLLEFIQNTKNRDMKACCMARLMMIIFANEQEKVFRNYTESVMVYESDSWLINRLERNYL